MIFLLILSLFFFWLIYREISTPQELNSIDKGYIAVMLSFALLSGVPVMNEWRFERFLSAKATILAEGYPTDVSCASVFESVYKKLGLLGTGDPSTGKIVLHYPTCNNLREYLDKPWNASEKAITSLHVFTHEAMHVRGELNEAKADCQAIQRDIYAAKLLGISDDIVAEETALAYYNGPYKNHPYFSVECAKGKVLDEDLSGSIW